MSLLREVCGAAADDIAVWRNRAQLHDVEDSAKTNLFALCQSQPSNGPLQLKLLRLLKEEGRVAEFVRHFHAVRGQLRDDGAFWRECALLLRELASLDPSADAHLAYLCALDARIRQCVLLDSLRELFDEIELYKRALEAAFKVVPRDNALCREYEARAFWHMGLVHQKNLARVSTAARLSTLRKAYQCFTRALQYLPAETDVGEDDGAETLALAAERVRGAGRELLLLVKGAREFVAVAGQVPTDQITEYQQLIQTEAKVLETLSSYDKLRVMRSGSGGGSVDVEAILEAGLWYIQYGKAHVLRSWWPLLSKRSVDETRRITDVWREMIEMDPATVE